MARKKLTKSKKLKKQNQRAARQRKKQRASLEFEKKEKEITDFYELVISKMLDDKCLVISKMEDGDLIISDYFIDLMYPYVNKLEASSDVKEKAIDMIADRLGKIHYEIMMEYLPDAKDIADTVVKRFNSGERSIELQEFVQKYCDGSEYFEWEDIFWDRAESQGFTIDDYEALPRNSTIRDLLDIKKRLN